MGNAVRHLFLLLISLLMAFSLVTAASAHVAEQVGCVETTSAGSEHFDGDSDEVPADTDTGYPHHHGGCHGHHVGVPITAEPVRHSANRRVQPLGRGHDRTAGATADPALRPPQA